MVGVTRRRLPRPVVWLLWLLLALAGSVVLGFLAGLARPREPDPWSPEPAPAAPDQDRTAAASSPADLSTATSARAEAT